jgi:hypothetical protein
MTMNDTKTETQYIDDIYFATGYGSAVAIARPRERSVGGSESAAAGQSRSESPTSGK